MRSQGQNRPDSSAQPSRPRCSQFDVYRAARRFFKAGHPVEFRHRFAALNVARQATMLTCPSPAPIEVSGADIAMFAERSAVMATPQVIFFFIELLLLEH